MSHFAKISALCWLNMFLSPQYTTSTQTHTDDVMLPPGPLKRMCRGVEGDLLGERSPASLPCGDSGMNLSIEADSRTANSRRKARQLYCVTNL